MHDDDMIPTTTYRDIGITATIELQMVRVSIHSQQEDLANYISLRRLALWVTVDIFEFINEMTEVAKKFSNDKDFCELEFKEDFHEMLAQFNLSKSRK